MIDLAGQIVIVAVVVALVVILLFFDIKNVRRNNRILNHNCPEGHWMGANDHCYICETQQMGERRFRQEWEALMQSRRFGLREYLRKAGGKRG